MARFSRAHVYLVYEAMFWSHPHAADDYDQPLVVAASASGRVRRFGSADEAVDFLHRLGFQGG